MLRLRSIPTPSRSRSPVGTGLGRPGGRSQCEEIPLGPLGPLLPRTQRSQLGPELPPDSLGAWLARTVQRHRPSVFAVMLGAIALPAVAQVAVASPIAATPPAEPPRDELANAPVGICHPAFGAANPSLAIETLPRDSQDMARWLDQNLGDADGAVSGRELVGYLPSEASASGLRAEGPMDRLLRAFAHGVGAGAVRHGPESTPRAEALARELTRAGGSADAADVALLVAEVARAPAPLLERTREAGITFVATRGSVLEHLPELQDERPRGWDVGRSWEAVPGLYHPAGREVVVLIRSDEHGRRCVPPIASGHGSDNLVMHELGHALDYGRVYRSVHSDAREFKEAYAADRERLNALGETYLLQADSAGREETFAESFGRYFGRDPDMASELPALHAYWQAFEQAHLAPQSGAGIGPDVPPQEGRAPDLSSLRRSVGSSRA